MRFSVIIPVYNKAESIAHTLDSVVSQSFTDYEIVVVNDGSSDGIHDALKPYMDKIRLIEQKNFGVSAARNTGIDASLGEFICFLDADDYWKPEHLEALDDAIRRYPEEKFFSSTFQIVSSDGAVSSKLKNTGGSGDAVIIENYFSTVLKKATLINTDTVCINREILSKEKFEVGEKVGEDTDLWYRIAAHNNLVLVEKDTAVYCMNKSTATVYGTNNLEWRFAKREAELMGDSSILPERKHSIEILLDRWRCTCSRELLIKGEDELAAKYMKEIRNKDKRFLFSKLLKIVPISLRGQICKLI